MDQQVKHKRGWHDPKDVKITHVMADGSVRDTLEGYRIPDCPAKREFIRLAKLMIANAQKTAT